MRPPALMLDRIYIIVRKKKIDVRPDTEYPTGNRVFFRMGTKFYIRPDDIQTSIPSLSNTFTFRCGLVDVLVLEGSLQLGLAAVSFAMNASATANISSLHFCYQYYFFLCILSPHKMCTVYFGRSTPYLSPSVYFNLQQKHKTNVSYHIYIF